jgi:hypothetical protein
VALADADLKRLKVLVSPAAWAAHQALSSAEQVSLEEAFEVHGDLRLVAADVLETVCLKAREKAVVAPGKKRIKVDVIEIEKAAVGTVSTPQADAWCALATRLRSQAGGSGVPGPAFAEWQGEP